jgi:two-component system, chemotaxis family, sensor kinase CheA
MSTQITEELAKVMRLLADAGPDDQDIIMNAGIQLEESMESLPVKSRMIDDLLELAWRALRHMYETDDFFITVKTGTMLAVNTIREYVLTGGDVDIKEFELSRNTLEKALSGNGESADHILPLSKEPSASDAATSGGPVTIDDISMYLISLSLDAITDEQLRKLNDMLFAFAGTSHPAVAAPARRAVEILEYRLAGREHADGPWAEALNTHLEEVVNQLMVAEFGNTAPAETAEEKSAAPTATHIVSTSAAGTASTPTAGSASNSASAADKAQKSAASKNIPAKNERFQIPADADTDLLQEFYTECSELIVLAEEALLELENDPTNSEHINRVFRAFHTIKGTSAFLGLTLLSDFAHSVETVLSMVRDGDIPFTASNADITLSSLDLIKEILVEVRDCDSGDIIKFPSTYHVLHERFDAIAENPSLAFESAVLTETTQELHVQIDIETTEFSFESPMFSGTEASNGHPSETAELPVASEASQNLVKPSSVPTPAAPTKNGTSAAEKPVQMTENGKSEGKGESKADAEQTTRVNTERLDRLIDMVGELVVAHSVVAEDPAIASSSDLVRKITHSSKILRELQDVSLRLRMVPLKATFQKMNRLVRDLSRKAGKQVTFITLGEETEIDRNMVDVINEPLVHMLRNAVDHGVEPSDLRTESGKTPVANVWLRAFQAGGKVIIEIEDDGRGLNRERIYSKAVDKGLIDPSKKMTDSEIYSLIFLPGFSTAEKVTDLSGRGVGMDVVKRSIDQLQGKVTIDSEMGRGTRISIELPFTLAITDGMLVRVGNQRFIIPTSNIDMTFRPEASALFTILGDSEQVMFRGSAIPVLRLHHMFGIPDATQNVLEGILMVINAGTRTYAVLIDEVLGQHHLVGKSINIPIKMHNISGGAILGDGQVGLILDTVTLLN